MAAARPRFDADAASDRAESDWNGLVSLAGVPPFAHSGWVVPWSAMVGRRLEMMVVRREGRPVAALPMIRRGGGVASAADWHVPILEAAAVDADALDTLARTITAGRRRVIVDFCDAHGATAAAFRRVLTAEGFIVRERVRMCSPYIELAGDGARERFHGSLGGKKRRELRRRLRRLEEEGDVEITIEDGSADLSRLLDEGFAVEGSGWKGAAGTAIRSRPRVDRFYREVARWASGQGWLRLGFLRVDGRAIAFDLSIVAGNTEWLLKTGYSPAWARYAPGSLLRAAAIERAFAQGLASYEFAGSAEPWKLEWTNTCRDIVMIDGFAPTPAGRTLLIGARVARRIRTLGKGGVSWRW